MRLLQFVRRHPIALFGVFAIAFVVWLWRDTLPSYDTGPDSSEPQVSYPRALPTPIAVLNQEDEADGNEKVKPTPQDTAQVLSKLKPGMTRAQVEELVGVPAVGDIHPATIADGKVTYHTTYEADFGPAPTVRPTRIVRPQPGRDPASRTLVALEFDATKQELISRSAKLAYPIRDGIPIMLPEEARKIE